MIYQQDWFMRQIESMTRAIANILFHKDAVRYEIEDRLHLTETDMLYTELERLLGRREIGKAEDLLYQSVCAGSPKDLELAVDFYQTVNALSDEELEQADFSREEILDGLKGIAKIFGVDELLL